MPPSDSRTVWSSEEGDLRKRAENAARAASLSPGEQTAYLHRVSKGRGGKVVTLVKNLALSGEDLKILAKRLKQFCGAGGTVKDGEIEIQGECREKAAEALRKLGYRVKIAGG